MNATVALTWLIILPLAASPLIYLIGRLSVRLFPEKDYNPAKWIAVLVLLGSGIPLYFAAQSYLSGERVELSYGVIILRLDGISLLLAATVLILGLLVSLYSTSYMAHETGEEKFYAMLSAMIGSIVGLGCARDLFNLWVWFEAMAISSYLLVAFYRQQSASLEAGFKYLVQSAVGTVLVLLGISLVFIQYSTLDLDLIRQNPIPSTTILLAAGALFLIGFGVKTALVPLHTWLPDAHSQAPSGISAMLSGVVIEAGLVAMLKALGSLGIASTSWGNLLLAFGVLNMLVGNLMALRQTQVKRLLAYSSVSHMGYMLLGFGVALAFGQTNGAAGGFFHLITHALMKGLAFLAAGAFLYALHLSRGSHEPLTVDNLDGASRRYPLAAFAFSIAVLGLGGLPPLAGFMSKWQIFTAGFESQNAIAIILVIFAALNSVLSLGYYAPLVNRIYRHEPSPIIQQGKPIPLWMILPLIVMTLAVVIIGFLPTLMNWLTQPAALDFMSLFAH